MTRDEAIKWVDDRMCWGRGTFTKNHPPNIDECWEAGCMAIKALKSDRPKGEWINLSLNILYPEFERYTCSVCGKHSYSYDFCPHCGSYNGGENHDKG